MKAWIKIMDDMYVMNDEDRCWMLEHPNKAKKILEEKLVEDGLVFKKVIETNIEYCGKGIKTFKELFELDIRGFETKVIKGKSKENQQLGIEDIYNFKPRVVK